MCDPDFIEAKKRNHRDVLDEAIDATGFLICVFRLEDADDEDNPEPK